MRFNNKVSRKAATITVISALTVAGGAGAAFAYWTTTGSGSDSTAVAPTNGDFSGKLNAVFDSAKLAPGTSRAVTFTAYNPSETDLQVRNITVALSGTKAGGGALSATDLQNLGVHVESDAVGGGSVVASNTTVPHGTSATTKTTLNGSAHLVIDNTPGNQDDLKGATITLGLTSN